MCIHVGASTVAVLTELAFSHTLDNAVKENKNYSYYRTMSVELVLCSFIVVLMFQN